MFKQHRGGEVVNGGTYVNFRTGELQVMPRGGTLPSGEHARYVKMPPLLLIFLGPLLGLLFVIFLPLSAPIFLLTLLVKRIGERLALQRKPGVSVVR